MRTSDKIGRVMRALRRIQSELPLVDKSGTVKIDGAGQTRVEKFAPHDEIWKLLQPLCDKYGITPVQPPGIGPNGCATVITRITWTSDDGNECEWFEGECPVNPPRPGFRDLGAFVSYIRRVMLLACFGIVAGADEPDQQEADKIKQVHPPRDNGARPHMSPADSEATATNLLRELDALPPGTTLVMVNELSKSFASLDLCDETRSKVGASFAAKRASLGLPDKPSAKKKP